MLEVLKDFEQSAGQLSLIIIAIPALASVILGLLMWLGGLAFRRFLLGAAGALAGAACGFFAMGHNLIATVALTVIATIAAVALERLFLSVLAAVLAVVFVLGVLERPQAGMGQESVSSTQGSATKPITALSIAESAKTLRKYAVDLGSAARQTCRSIPGQHWAAAGLAGVVFLIAGLKLPRFAGAWAFSALGAAAIFAGIIVLLSYKGSTPISSIRERGPYYGAVFAAMAGLGTVEQLLLCKKPTRKTTNAKDSKNDEQKRKSWRGM